MNVGLWLFLGYMVGGPIVVTAWIMAAEGVPERSRRTANGLATFAAIFVLAVGCMLIRN